MDISLKTNQFKPNQTKLEQKIFTRQVQVE